MDEELPVFVCSECHGRQSVTEYHPAAVTCLSCGRKGTAPPFRLFGRSEWEMTDEPKVMLERASMRGVSISERQLRLVVCATARREFPDCQDVGFRSGLACGEEWADADTEPAEAGRLFVHLNSISGDYPWVNAARSCLEDPIQAVMWWEWCDSHRTVADAVREVLANPFVTRVWQPDWLTSTVRALAGHIYAARDFGAMPILADALQDAGCADEEVLNHCRVGRFHARGCWVLDALLGKS
jgi:hypothetical protein